MKKCAKIVKIIENFAFLYVSYKIKKPYPAYAEYGFFSSKCIQNYAQITLTLIIPSIFLSFPRMSSDTAFSTSMML